MTIEPFIGSRDHPRESRPLDPHLLCFPWSPKFSRAVESSAVVSYGGKCPGGGCM